MKEINIREYSLQVLIHREADPSSDYSAGAVWMETPGKGDVEVFIVLPEKHYRPILQQSKDASQEICLTGRLPIAYRVHPSSEAVSSNPALFNSYILRRPVSKDPTPDPINANEAGEEFHVEPFSSEADLSLVAPFSTIGTRLIHTPSSSPRVVSSGLILDCLKLVDRFESDLVFELENGNSFDSNSNYLSAPVFSAKGVPIALAWGCSNDRTRLFAIPFCNRSNLIQLKGIDITATF